MKLLKVLAITLLFTALQSASAVLAAPREAFFIGDTEGMIEGLQTYIDSGDLKTDRSSSFRTSTRARSHGN